MTMQQAGSRFNLMAWVRPYFSAVLLLLVFLFVAGLVSLWTMPCGIYPEVAFPRIVIIATVPNLGIRSVEISVTRPLEEAANFVQGVTCVRSKTVRGAAELSVDFAPGTDMIQALNDIRARLSDIAAQLPPDTQLIVERQTPSVFPIISVAVTGHRSLVELRDYAFYDLRPRISRIADVSYVTVQGGDVREVVVEAEPQALAAAGLSVDRLAELLGKTQRLAALGRLDRTVLQYQVLTDTFVQDPRMLEELVVLRRGNRLLRLKDVARVSVWHEDRTVAVRTDGRDAVVLTVFRRPHGNALNISRELKQVLADAQQHAPAGIRVQVVYDQAELVTTSLENVRDALVVGGFFALLILLAFLRSVRATMIAGMCVVATLVISFVFLRLTSETLNLMSLGGLAVAIGLVIDDVVVVIENITRHLNEKEDTEEAVSAASLEISGAVVGSTLTNILVFVPLIFVHGVVGQFFQSLSLALAVAIVVSMVISLTVVPVLAARLLEGQRTPPPGRFFQKLSDVYESAIRFGLRWPRVVLVLSLLMIVPGWWLYQHVETGFMPEMDEGAFVLDYFMPAGTSLNETDRVLRQVEQVLLETPEIESYVRRTGAELGFFATEAYTGDILISLKKQRHKSMSEVMAELRERLERKVPQLEIEFVPLIADQINDLSGVEAPIEIKVFGPDYDELRRLAERLGSQLEQVPGLVDIDPHVRQGNPDIVVRTDSVRAAQAGLSAAQVQQQLEAALYGKVACVLPQQDRLTKVRVRWPDQVRYDLDGLADFPLMTPSGRAVPLRAVARLVRRRSLNELWRENQQPMINVTAEIEGRDLGSVIRDIQHLLQRFPTPPGYRLELAGNYENQQQAFVNLAVVLAVAATLVFIVMAVQFRSVGLPLLNFMTLPLSLTAALFALWVTNTPLNVSSFMGAILLIGLDVKNGILLIERVRQLQEKSLPLEEALALAGRQRFRPILMTSLTTLFGLLPLALGIGPGAQMQQPLAVATIGGLTADMLFTRLIIPVGYLALKGRGGEERESNN